MAINLLDFARNCRRLAKQAFGSHAGKPASGGLPRWVHVVVHCLRVEEGWTYPEVIDRLSLMPGICELLGLLPEALPDPTTFWHSFDRYAMRVWRALLRVSAQQHPNSGHVALDSTFFERGHASHYYLKRADRTIKTLKVTTLTDTESLAVLDVHCSAKWRHDTILGRKLVRRNADELVSVAADKAFHNWPIRYEYMAESIEPLLLRSGSTLGPILHNTLIRSNGYTQRWMAETSYSSTKRSLGSELRSLGWYRQFREIVLMFAVHNIENLSETL
ncbi:IS5 family transposase [Natrialba sp. INN-245]|uniref:IS5 family transposase n=1 Tax=Natrialba sp. INN-245 TaxID=2690967 RepID=UPI0013112FEC|nr:IS5 family transposase [Natrialba sp. INN-245]MWV40211.1 IS5 family transposase [Natrialba sp. INN-245]